MDLVGALVTLTALLAATAALATYVLWRQARPRPPVEHETIVPQRLGADGLGDLATLLQFSTHPSARCPSVHRTLAAIAEDHDGVRHLDIDVTDRPDIAKHFRVLQTPTTFVLDREGVIRTRFGGAPSRDVLELELNRLIAQGTEV